MCREHAPDAVATLVAALKDPRHKVAAALALLDRGFGKPVQAITTNPDGAPAMLHLLAAQAVGGELLAALDGHRVINNDVEPVNGQADGEIVDLLSLPPPLE